MWKKDCNPSLIEKDIDETLLTPIIKMKENGPRYTLNYKVYTNKMIFISSSSRSIIGNSNSSEVIQLDEEDYIKVIDEFNKIFSDKETYQLKGNSATYFYIDLLESGEKSDSIKIQSKPPLFDQIIRKYQYS